MNKTILLITGGTGGHVIPAKNLANYLLDQNINCILMTDRRGYRYISNFKGKVYLVNGSNLNGGILIKFFGILNLFLGFIQSLFIILFLKPSNVISFGSYASFSPLLSSLILKPFYRIKIYIHEQNSVLGRTNRFFLKYVNKLFLNFDISKKIDQKFRYKTFIVGLPQKKIIDTIIKKKTNYNSKFTIFIFGGSQGSEYISNFAIRLIKSLYKDDIINANFKIQAPKNMVNKIKESLQNVDYQITIKEFFYNIEEVLNNTSLAISRAGAGSINDLILYNIPSILIPLPTSKDNHQFYNASIMRDNKVGIIIEQNFNELFKAKNYIYQNYNNISEKNLMNNRFNKIKVKNSNSLIYKIITNDE